MRWRACIAVAATTGVSLAAVSCGRIGYDPLELGEPPGTGGDGGGTDATGADGTLQSGDSAASDATTTNDATDAGDAAAPNDAGSAADTSDGSSGSGTDTGTPDGASGADARTDADAATGADAASVTIAIDPRQTATLTGGSITFNAEVTGSTDTAVTWSVQEGSAGGTVASGTFTAPTTAGVYHVVATSHAYPSATAIAVVTVSAPASATFATWQNVTPATVDAGASWGLRDVVADPVRPSDLYAVVCLQGVYKSTDYGVTWALVSTGTGSAALAANCIETLTLGSSPLRDPGTPPTLYAGNIHGGWFGVQKSTDGGQNFTRYATPASTPGTVGGIDVDPGDEQHLLAGMDSGGAVAESFDAGVTWRAIAGPGSTFSGVQPFFIDTGIPSTTRTTWLIVTSGGGVVGGGGAWRTTDSGAHWTQADTFGHGAGTLQMFQAGGGVLYIGGQYGTSTHSAFGIYTSADYGASWSLAYSGNGAAVVGTPSYLYAWNDWGNSGGVAPAMKRAPRSAGTPWTALTTPAAMTNGPSKAAVTFDGSHWVIVGGCWNGGLFRYAEL